ARDFDRLLEHVTGLRLPRSGQLGRNRPRIGRGKRSGRERRSEEESKCTLHRTNPYFPARSASISCQWTTLSYSDWTGMRSSLPCARKSVGTTTQAPLVPYTGIPATRNGRASLAPVDISGNTGMPGCSVCTALV